MRYMVLNSESSLGLRLVNALIYSAHKVYALCAHPNRERDLWELEYDYPDKFVLKSQDTLDQFDLLDIVDLVLIPMPYDDSMEPQAITLIEKEPRLSKSIILAKMSPEKRLMFYRLNEEMQLIETGSPTGLRIGSRLSTFDAW